MHLSQAYLTAMIAKISKRAPWKWTCENPSSNFSKLWNLIAQYFDSLLTVFLKKKKTMLLFCTLDLGAAYCWTTTKCDSRPLVQTFLNDNFKYCVWVTNVNKVNWAFYVIWSKNVQDDSSEGTCDQIWNNQVQFLRWSSGIKATSGL